MKAIVTSVALTIFLTGCAHQFMRGTVAMKTDEKTAHVCLGDKDVKVGDKLDFYSNDCSGFYVIEIGKCELKRIGSGTVTKLLNNHYSEVRIDGSFKFSEGTLVEKANK